MRLFTETVQVHIYKIVLLLIAFSAIAFAIIFYYTDNPKLGSIFSGIATGLIVAALQLLIQGLEHRDIENVKKLKIRKILPTRDDKELYGELLIKSKRQIHLLGNTAYRFLDDFADKNRADRQQLLMALERNVEVKLLLPTKEYLTSESDKRQFEQSQTRMNEIKVKHSNFEFKYYERYPSHNLLRVDNDCLVGPIFPNIKSKDSPAIYTDISSDYVRPYLTFYDELWDGSNATL